ncbi:MAG: ArsC family reductase [Methylococcales bacterium]
MITLYGIKNCDTMKKASRYCQDHSIEFRLHDYRVDGLDHALLLLWVKELSWEALLNKRSTSWRSLSDQIKNQINEASAITAMLAHTSLIKRPLLEFEGRYLLGFSVEQYDAFFNDIKRV